MKLKLIALLLALASATATARDVAYIRNNAGGLITLTDTPCNLAGSFLAYSTAQVGSVVWGCWTVGGPHVWVRWDNGQVNAYIADTFTRVDR